MWLATIVSGQAIEEEQKQWLESLLIQKEVWLQRRKQWRECGTMSVLSKKILFAVYRKCYKCTVGEIVSGDATSSLGERHLAAHFNRRKLRHCGLRMKGCESFLLKTLSIGNSPRLCNRDKKRPNTIALKTSCHAQEKLEGPQEQFGSTESGSSIAAV